MEFDEHRPQGQSAQAVRRRAEQVVRGYSALEHAERLVAQPPLSDFDDETITLTTQRLKLDQARHRLACAKLLIGG